MNINTLLSAITIAAKLWIAAITQQTPITEISSISSQISSEKSGNGGAAFYAALAIVAFFIILFIIRAIVKKLSFPNYEKKDALMTQTEIAYFNAIKSLIGDKYIVYPQINLASVIDKKGERGFRTELFRNADFGVFDYNFSPVILIEINDRSHLRKDRVQRDEKVAKICKKAGLPIVTFWTKDGIELRAIYSQLRKYLDI